MSPGLRWTVYALALANVVTGLWLLRPARDPVADGPPPDAPRLELLDEGGLARDAGAQQAVHRAPAGRGRRGREAAASCWRVRTRQREQARRLVARALEAGLVPSMREVAERRVVGYWVYLPPAKDRAAGLEAVRRLREAGIRDVQLLGGARANAVSLGLFRSRELAEQRRARIAALGFEPVVEVHRRTVTLWEVTLTGGDRGAARGLVESVAPGAAVAPCGTTPPASGESQ